MIIYKITNKINGKIYIGQTVNDLSRRWSQHISCAKRKDTNMSIVNAIRKYGKDNFDIEEIDRATCLQELSIKEEFFINMLNSFSPIGYNLKEVLIGNNIARKIVTRKKWLFLSPTNELIEVMDLTKFCKENGLRVASMTRIYNGDRFNYNNWRCPFVDNKSYVLKNIDSGEFFILNEGIGYKDFANLIKCNQASISNLIRKKIKSTHGWIIQEEKIIKGITIPDGILIKKRIARKCSKKTRTKLANVYRNKFEKYKLLDNKNLKLYSFSNISSFCRKVNLSMPPISNLLNKKVKSVKLFSIPEKPLRRYKLFFNKNYIEIVEGEIKKFCRENNLLSASFFNLLKGKTKEYRGYQLISSFIPDASTLQEIDCDIN